MCARLKGGPHKPMVIDDVALFTCSFVARDTGLNFGGKNRRDLKRPTYFLHQIGVYALIIFPYVIFSGPMIFGYNLKQLHFHKLILVFSCEKIVKNYSARL